MLYEFTSDLSKLVSGAPSPLSLRMASLQRCTVDVKSNGPSKNPLGGVAVLPDAEARPVYRALLGRFAELARERGCAVATAVSNPFWPDDGLYREFLAPDYALENISQVLNLESALDADGHFTGGTSNLRRNLRKALAGRLWIDDEQSLANVEEWYEIHRTRHTEIGARPLPKLLFTGA